MQRRNDLDVLRSIAVTAVVFYHVGIPNFQNGFIGVDIFFVLSGFLIVKSILFRQEKDKFSIRDFLESRARRIFPALILVLAINIPILFYIFSPLDFRQVMVSYLSIVTLVPNLYFWSQSGYFDPKSDLQPFLHTWSLGIEIQFYVLIGILMAVLTKYSQEKKLVRWLKSISLVSFFACTLLAIYKPGINFYLIPSRLWEFALGGLVATRLQKQSFPRMPKWILIRLKILGLSLVIFSIVFPISIKSWPNSFTTIPVLGACLVIISDEQTRIASRIFENRFLILIGKVSFGWFLWHWPIIVYSNYLTDYQVSQRTLILIAFVTLIVAMLQWYYFERKYVTIGRITSKHFLKVTLISLIALSVIGTSAVVLEGYKQAWKMIRVSSFEKGTTNAYLSRSLESNIVVPDSACKFNLVEINNLENGIFKKCAKEHGPAILIIGDSHGIVFYDIVEKSKLPKFVINLSRPASRPSSGLDGQYSDALNLVSNHGDKISKVLFLQSGSYLLEDKFGRVDTVELFRSDAKISFSKKNISATVRYLELLSQYVEVVWVGPYAQGRVNVNNPKNWYRAKAISNHVLEEFTRLDAKLEQSLKASKVEYESSVEEFRFQKDRILVNGCIVWRDEDHFSECGRLMLAREKIQFLSSLLELDGPSGTDSK